LFVSPFSFFRAFCNGALSAAQICISMLRLSRKSHPAPLPGIRARMQGIIAAVFLFEKGNRATKKPLNLSLSARSRDFMQLKYPRK